MKFPSCEYDEAVEKHQKQIRGNISSVKMTPSECAAEVKAITGDAMSSFAEAHKILSPAEGVDLVFADGSEVPEGKGIYGDIHMNLNGEVQPKKRRGRPPGSRNKPK